MTHTDLSGACRLAAIACALSLYLWAMYLVYRSYGGVTLWAVASVAGLVVCWCGYLTTTKPEDDPT